ncbi:MAG: hypothetical protein WA960_03445 [Tunicatimonas sp.]
MMNPFKKNLDVDEKFLLAHRYRRVGVWICILGVPTVLLVVSVIMVALDLSIEFWREWGMYFINLPICVGLYLILFSQEKEEDELYLNLRLRSLAYSVYSIVVTIALLPVFASLGSLVIGRGIVLPDLGGNMAVCTLLLLAANFAYFHNKSRIIQND